MNSRFYVTTVSVAMIASLALFATGCGDSNNNGFVYSPTTTNTSTNIIQPGRYVGTNSITGQQGNLDITVATGGAITGTFKIAAPAAVARTVTVIPVGIYNVTGSGNLATGSFTLTGSIPGLGNFSFTGMLPTGASQGMDSITIDGSTYGGSIAAYNTTAAPGGGTARIVMRGGVLTNFQFTPGGTYNGVNPPVTTASLIGGTVITGSTSNNGVTLGLEEVTVAGTSLNIRSLAFSVYTQGNPLVVGQSYPLIPTAGGNGSAVVLSETTGTHLDKSWAPAGGTTGSATVTSLTATTVEMDFQFSNVGPNTGAATSTATGTFTTSGHILGTF